ncbi:MAG: HupE/UreJ family protein [Bacteroidia bacterium]
MKEFYKSKSFILFFLLLLFSCTNLFAHTINYSMEVKPVGNVISYYTWLGFQHIIPEGFDHILFILGLFLLDPRIKSVIMQASCFTVAHTITLILSSKGIIIPPSRIIEPIIAISIVFVALENIFIGELKPWRYALVFAFGLIHGMGFANALNEIGLPRNTFYTSLISFNVGVELGQITVILIAYALIGKWFSKEIWYRQRIVYPLSAMIALIATFWTVQRIFFT